MLEGKLSSIDGEGVLEGGRGGGREGEGGREAGGEGG